MSHTKAAVGTLAVLAAGAGAYLYYTDPNGANNAHGMGRMNRHELFAEYLRTKRTRFTTVTAAPGAPYKRFSLTEQYRTTVVARTGNIDRVSSSAETVALCNNWKAAMQAAGRGDEDWRCNLWLYCYETAWDKYCWGWNTGNRKAHPHILVANDPENNLFSDQQHVDGVYVLKDGLMSIDLYYTYKTLDDGLRAEREWFLRNGGLYNGVLEAFRAGGLDGLIAARRIMLSHGYSGHGTAIELAAEERANRQYWNLMVGRVGNGVFSR